MFSKAYRKVIKLIDIHVVFFIVVILLLFFKDFSNILNIVLILPPILFQNFFIAHYENKAILDDVSEQQIQLEKSLLKLNVNMNLIMFIIIIISLLFFQEGEDLLGISSILAFCILLTWLYFEDELLLKRIKYHYYKSIVFLLKKIKKLLINRLK